MTDITANPVFNKAVEEARRQAQVCNSCRYCEGYCSVFPALHRQRAFASADITQLANLCHNCRGCYYACQFVEPHEYALNFPRALAQVRQDSWQQFAFPRVLGSAFHRSGFAIAAGLVVAIAALIWLASVLGAASRASADSGFYALMSHGLMVAIFTPAFLLPLVSVGISLRRYWRYVGGERVAFADLKEALGSAARMKNLDGGHGEGCNFEDEDRFTQGRRHVHHAVMYGFLLCFASTSTATVLHYVFNQPAPYGFFSLPKLLGVSGGLLLSLGTVGMLMLKRKSDPQLSDERVRGGDFGFIALLFFVSTSGLLLYALGATPLLSVLLYLHLGSVLAFFLLLPYSKMVHGFYRLAALLREAQLRRNAAP